MHKDVCLTLNRATLSQFYRDFSKCEFALITCIWEQYRKGWHKLGGVSVTRGSSLTDIVVLPYGDLIWNLIQCQALQLSSESAREQWLYPQIATRNMYRRMPVEISFFSWDGHRFWDEDLQVHFVLLTWGLLIIDAYHLLKILTPLWNVKHPYSVYLACTPVDWELFISSLARLMVQSQFLFRSWAGFSFWHWSKPGSMLSIFVYTQRWACSCWDYA